MRFLLLFMYRDRSYKFGILTIFMGKTSRKDELLRESRRIEFSCGFNSNVIAYRLESLQERKI